MNPKPFTVSCDIDGTLIDIDDQPNRDVVELLGCLHRLGAKIIFMSGGGANYALMWARRCSVDQYGSAFLTKPSPKDAEALGIDLHLDDQLTGYGKISFQISPISTAPDNMGKSAGF
jgi:hypothetical protein